MRLFSKVFTVTLGRSPRAAATALSAIPPARSVCSSLRPCSAPMPLQHHARIKMSGGLLGICWVPNRPGNEHDAGDLIHSPVLEIRESMQTPAAEEVVSPARAIRLKDVAWRCYLYWYQVRTWM